MFWQSMICGGGSGERVLEGEEELLNLGKLLGNVILTRKRYMSSSSINGEREVKDGYPH